MSTALPRVTVVMAATAKESVCPERVGRFIEEVGERGEVVLVESTGDRIIQSLEQRYPSLRVIRRLPGALAPELWRDGMRATRGEYIAFTTASMSPCAGWLDRMIEQLGVKGAVGVGGPILPGEGLKAQDRAVYLLRYLAYHMPLGPGGTVEPPGDNAIYCRASLDGLEEITRDGFWEVEVHRALRARGLTLEMAEDATVSFEGGSSFPAMLEARFRHARIFGRYRAQRLGLAGKAARTGAAPLVPLVMVARVLGLLKAKQIPVRPWIGAFPRALVLASAWAAGEAVGLWDRSKGKDRRSPAVFPRHDRQVMARQRVEA